jgi:hypothetical protein
MSVGPLLDRIGARVALDKEEGDIAYFHALTLHLEYVTKLVTAAIVACVADDLDRQRYSLEHRLVRADAIGDWAEVLNVALTGPAAQHLIPEAAAIARQLTERVGYSDWRYSAVLGLRNAAARFGLDVQVGARVVALRQFFRISAAIRNRTRGHGAATSEECGDVCPLLAGALDTVSRELELFKLPWVYLHRNLSGKFRVSPLLGQSTSLEYLKKTRDVTLPDGIYIDLGRPVGVPLVFSDADLRDVLVPNGAFRTDTFEALSYVTNEVARKDGSPWATPPGRLPPSETEGRTALEQVGNTFGNVPPRPFGYVQRTALEVRLREELLRTERHPIVSLTGPGGIGKTTLAIASIEALTALAEPPYDVVVWMSARDIDLLDSGPKPVAPRVVRGADIARAVVELLEPSGCSDPGFKADTYFEGCLQRGAAGPTLFVLDNFETLENPSDVFHWVDTHIRLPNKVLITTRFREFAGDYPIEIGGMTEDEALALISEHAARLGIGKLLGADYKQELIRESDGHPYVIKILLGQVAREQRAVKPERIVASADHLLTALFERTFDKLSPAGQRIFLLLCSWRVFVPTVAVEAISLRPGNERFDVAAALNELRRFALVDEVGSGTEKEPFIGVPLAAASFGRRKLEVSPFKVAVEEDRKLLLEFGAGKREDAHRGALPRIDRLVRSVAARASVDAGSLEGSIPVLEYLASRVPKAYLLLADLVLEVDEPRRAAERARTYLRRFLETAPAHEKQPVWLRIADLCHSINDAVGEVHALAEAALLPTVTSDEIGSFANRINNRMRELKGRLVEDAWSPEVRLLIERVAGAMEKHTTRLSAIDCSRLAWLYLNIGNEGRARDIAVIGMQRDPNEEHCQNLIRRLGR